MAKTPEYTKKAVSNYRSKYDLAQIRLPKGTRDRADKNNISINDIAVSAVLAYLDALERKADNLPQETEKTAEKAGTERTEVDEKIALIQANERLHALQAKTAAERAAREHGEVKPVIKHPPKWAGLPGQRPDESNVEWVERKTAEANEIYKSAMECLKAEKESETK